MTPVVANPLSFFWFRIGHSHLQCVRAASEDAARRIILATHRHASGQRVEILPVRYEPAAAPPPAPSATLSTAPSATMTRGR